jgi:hypothetical protein
VGDGAAEDGKKKDIYNPFNHYAEGMGFFIFTRQNYS